MSCDMSCSDDKEWSSNKVRGPSFAKTLQHRLLEEYGLRDFCSNPQYNYGCRQDADGNSLFVARHAPCDRDTTSESEQSPASTR